MGSKELFRLDGKAALVTGSSRGLGRAMAEALASAGAAVAVNARTRKTCETAAREIAASSGNDVFPFAADVSKPEESNALVEACLDRFGKIDILVNNAGLNVRGDTTTYRDADWNTIISVNLYAVFALCRAVAGGMMERRWGRIINMGSIHSIVSMPLRAAYAASKGGVMQMTKSLALEWAPYGITVNAICPGVFETPINRVLMDDPEAHAAVVAKIPLGRMGQPEELAGAVLLLASEAGGYITGSALVVDGGYTSQ